MYSMDGFATAFGEITLVLFTTLAPAGALAYGLMALPLIVQGTQLPVEVRRRLDQLLCVPVVVAMVGLVASATHLGNPANALYILAGVGRSPLSNEVACGVVFLGCAGVFWLTSFSESGGRVQLRRVVAAITSVLGIVFTGAIAAAYDVDTILTWSTPLAIVSQWLNGLIGGPLLAILGLRLAHFFIPGHRWGNVYLCIAVAATAANVIVYIIWGAQLPSMANAVTSADTLAPFFGVMIALFAALCTVAIFLGSKAAACKGETPIWVPLLSVLCALSGIFVMRFSFYMTHMTVGLGV